MGAPWRPGSVVIGTAKRPFGETGLFNGMSSLAIDPWGEWCSTSMARPELFLGVARNTECIMRDKLKSYKNCVLTP